jgi:CDP-paratose 2-epimerase
MKENDMDVAIVTGSAGLIGSEAVRFFSQLGMHIVGLDNDMRKFFFGEEASTEWNRKRLETEVSNYEHFERFGKSVTLIIHTAAQPSHDWAARDPFSDFSVNANGTLNLLQATRQYCPESSFIFTSTNKVYGDLPNFLPLIEQDKRWEIDSSHPYASGIAESMSIDQSKHSLFGASKVAADVLVQEYGRYFGLKTASFRGGCLTGPSHSGTQLHGFLAYLMRCVATGKPYTIFGYKGKQVRDNIHSSDLISAFYEFYKNPTSGEVYNIGGGRTSNCSMLEAVELCQEIAGQELDYSYTDENRSGDHIWYISDLSKFQQRYPNWSVTYNVPGILQEIYDQNIERWVKP